MNKSLLIVLVLSLGNLARAEDPAPPPSPPRSGSSPRPDVPNLSDAQKQQIRQLVQSRHTDAEPMTRAYAAARRIKLEAMLTTPSEEAKIRAACAEFAKTDAEMSVFISKLYNDILPLMTEEQRLWLVKNRENLIRYLQMQIESGLERSEQPQKQKE